jgi:hypothetical protein
MSDQQNFDHLSDTEILELAGPYGPGIIGQELFDRAQKIRSRGDDGKLGPALTDPDFAAKQAAKRALEPKPEPTEPKGDAPPKVATWEGVTVSGLKLLAQQRQVSYTPQQGKKRDTLIAVLEAAGVKPPEPAPE